MLLRLLPLIFIAASTCAQTPATIKLGDLQKLINKKSDHVQVINFWATWCGPCIKELPYFEKVTAENRPDVKITLVSMDLDLNPDAEKVYKFVARKNLKSEVLLLDEKDPNSWINKIDKEWNGSLPATLIINQKTGQRKFVGKELHEGELEKLISEVKSK
ncbi:MAG TPA: TlpA disulfide reductase family protein [Sphingobacteriaceae bacterium]